MYTLIREIQDPRLKETVFGMGNTVLNSRSENTYKKYRTYFLKLKAWYKTFDFQDLPALPCTVAVYLIQINSSAAVIDAAYYSIQWPHCINLCNNPCDNSLMNLILEGGKRLRTYS